MPQNEHGVILLCWLGAHYSMQTPSTCHVCMHLQIYTHNVDDRESRYRWAVVTDVDDLKPASVLKLQRGMCPCWHSSSVVHVNWKLQ